MDMHFYWIRDHVRQGQFHIYWQKGQTYKADYFTKHHSRKHHQQMRPVYFVDPVHCPNYSVCFAPENGDYSTTSSLSDPPTAGKGVLFATVSTSVGQPVSLADHGIHQYLDQSFDSNLVAHNN
jgi:hypothetical protein